MEVIQFFFGSFWHFIGLVIVLCIIGEVILKLVYIIVRKDDPDKNENDFYQDDQAHIDYLSGGSDD